MDSSIAEAHRNVPQPKSNINWAFAICKGSGGPFFGFLQARSLASPPNQSYLVVANRVPRDARGARHTTHFSFASPTSLTGSPFGRYLLANYRFAPPAARQLYTSCGLPQLGAISKRLRCAQVQEPAMPDSPGGELKHPVRAPRMLIVNVEVSIPRTVGHFHAGSGKSSTSGKTGIVQIGVISGNSFRIPDRACRRAPAPLDGGAGVGVTGVRCGILPRATGFRCWRVRFLPL